MRYRIPIAAVLFVCALRVFADVDTGTVALCDTIQAGNVALAKRALGQGVDWETACPDVFGYPLQITVDNGNVELVQLLLEHGAPVDQANAFMGGAPLHAAAMTGDVPMLELLLKHGADVNATDEEGFTATDAVRIGGHEDMLRLLIARGGVLGRMAEETKPEGSASPTKPEARAKETPRYTGDGSPILRGLHLGIPADAAARPMLEYGLPPGGVQGKPYERVVRGTV